MWCHVVLALIVANAICHISHARVERKMRDDDLVDRFVRKSYRYATIEAAQFTMIRGLNEGTLRILDPS